jgi:hypothetical protein
MANWHAVTGDSLVICVAVMYSIYTDEYRLSSNQCVFDFRTPVFNVFLISAAKQSMCV